MRKKLLISMLIACTVMANLTACEKKEAASSASPLSQSASIESSSASSSAISEDYKAEDYVTKLGEYKGLEYTKISTDITDDQIDAVISQFLSQHPEKLSSGTVKDGDTVNIDYSGKKDGVAFEGGTASGQALKIGSKTFIDGFETGLIGHKVGETLDLNLKFPDEYRQEGQPGSELNGAKVVFTVTINYIEGDAPKKLTDELVSENTEYKTVDEYKKAVKETLKENAEKNARNTAESELLTQVVTNSAIKALPASVHDRFYNQFLTYYKTMAAQYGMQFSSFLAQLQTTEDKMNEAAEAYATNMGGQLLCMKVIANKENLNVTDDEYKDGLSTYFKSQGQGYPDEATFEQSVGKQSIMEVLLADKVVKFLMDNGKAVEKKESSTTSGSAASSSK